MTLSTVTVFITNFYYHYFIIIIIVIIASSNTLIFIMIIMVIRRLSSLYSGYRMINSSNCKERKERHVRDKDRVSLQQLGPQLNI